MSLRREQEFGVSQPPERALAIGLAALQMVCSEVVCADQAQALLIGRMARTRASAGELLGVEVFTHHEGSRVRVTSQSIDELAITDFGKHARNLISFCNAFRHYAANPSRLRAVTPFPPVPADERAPS